MAGSTPCLCSRTKDPETGKITRTDHAPPDPFCPKHGDPIVILKKSDCTCVVEADDFILVDPWCVMHEVVMEQV